MRRETPRLTLIAVLLTLSAFAISANAIPPLITTIADALHARYQAFGYVIALQYLCFALASLTGGWFTERLGLRERTLVVCGVAGMAVLFYLGAFVQGFAWFVLWIVPVGFAGGLTETFGSIMVARFGRRDSSKLLCLSQVFFCLGAIAAPQLVAILLERQVSWRTAFVIFGTCIGAIAILFTALTRARTGGNTHAPPTRPPDEQGMPFSFREPLFVLLAVSMFLYVSIEQSVACWIAPFFEKQLGLPADGAATRLALFWAGLVAGRLVVLALPARWTLWPAFLTSSAGMTLALGLLSFGWTTATASGIVVAAGFLSGPIWPVIVTASRHVRGSARFAAGVIAAGAFGAATGPLLSSRLIAWLGWTRFFPVLTGGSALFFLVVVATRRRARGAARA